MKDLLMSVDYECSKYGLKFIKCPIRHLGTEKSAKIMEDMYDYIVNQGVEVITKEEIIEIDMKKKTVKSDKKDIQS